MSELARPRFYVIATTGFSATAHSGHGEATSFAVLDRLWAFREVFYAPVQSSARAEAFRRAACERVAEALNARHEQHMREVA